MEKSIFFPSPIIVYGEVQCCSSTRISSH